MTTKIRSAFLAGAWLAAAALFSPALAEGPAAKRYPDLAVICPSRQLRARRQVIFDLAGSSTPPAAPGYLSRQCRTLPACFATALDAEAAGLGRHGTSGKLSVLAEIGGDFGFDRGVFHRDARIAGVDIGNQGGLVALGQCLKANGGDPERCRATRR